MEYKKKYFTPLKKSINFDAMSTLESKMAKGKYVIYTKKKKARKKSTKRLFKYKVESGFFNCEVDIKTLSCDCKQVVKGYCDHIEAVLYFKFGFTSDTLPYLRDHEDVFFISLATEEENSYVGLKFNTLIKKTFSEKECVICFEHLNTGCTPNKLFRCHYCREHFHQGCMETWFHKDRSMGSKEKTCPKCRSIVLF